MRSSGEPVLAVIRRRFCPRNGARWLAAAVAIEIHCWDCRGNTPWGRTAQSHISAVTVEAVRLKADGTMGSRESSGQKALVLMSTVVPTLMEINAAKLEPGGLSQRRLRH